MYFGLVCELCGVCFGEIHKRTEEPESNLAEQHIILSMSPCLSKTIFERAREGRALLVHVPRL